VQKSYRSHLLFFYGAFMSFMKVESFMSTLCIVMAGKRAATRTISQKFSFYVLQKK